MSNESGSVKRRIMDPSGEELTLDRLPPPDTTRWVIRRKAQIVAAVRGGLLSFEEACARWSLSPEELESWVELTKNHGLAGLRATKIGRYRRNGSFA